MKQAWAKHPVLVVVALVLITAAATTPAYLPITGGVIRWLATLSKPVADVYAFGAVGDDSHDDTSAIQAAINSLPAGGGTVQACAGTFKVTSTLWLPNGVTLRGCNSGGFAYETTPNMKSVIDASGFTNLNSWIIDTKVFNGSTPLAYNDFTSTGYGYIYQVGVENLAIETGTQTSTPIFGAVRIAFAPHSTVQNVTVNGANVGIAFAAVYSFESHILNWHSFSNYYGCLLMNTSGAFVFDGICDAQYTPSQLTIPAPVTAAVFGSGFTGYLDDVGLDAAHATTGKGLVLWGGFPTLTEDAGSVTITAQYWPDAVFAGNGAYGWTFPFLYTEGTCPTGGGMTPCSGAGSNQFVYTGAYSSVNILGVATYNATYLADSGYDSRAWIHANQTTMPLNALDNVSEESYSGGDRTAVVISDYAGPMPGSIPARVSFINGPSGENYLQGVVIPNGVSAIFSSFFAFNNGTVNNGYTVGTSIRQNNTSELCWTNSNTDSSPATPCDSGISRTGIHTIAAGNGTEGDDSGTFDAGGYQKFGVPWPYVGTTGSIGGSSLAAGACATGTATLAASATGHTGTAVASDGTVQGNYYVLTTVSGTTATVSVCATTSGTPTAKAYNVTVW